MKQPDLFGGITNVRRRIQKRGPQPPGTWKKYYNDPVRKAKHLAAVRITDKKRVKVIREYVTKTKLERGCRVCGFKEHHAALDFAHRDRNEKECDVGDMLRSGWSLERVKIEVAKCDVVCANHHRIETFHENIAIRNAGTMVKRN